MGGEIAVVLERPSGPDKAAGRPLWGDIGQILIRTFHHYAIEVLKDCVVTYAIPDGNVTGERISLVKPQVERLQLELAGCTKILACGALAYAAVMPLDSIPTKYMKKRGRGQMTAWGSPPKFVVPTYSVQQVWAEPDYYRDLAFDVQKIIHQDAPHRRPDVKVIVVRTLDELRTWLNRISSASIIACDIETTGFDPLTDTIDSIGLGVMYPEDNKGLTVIIPRELLYPPVVAVQELLLSFLGPCSAFKGCLVYQNFQFDARHLRMYLGDWPFHPNISDTLLLNYGIDERPIGRFGVHSLKDMSRYRFDIEDYSFDWDAFRATPPEQRDMATMYAYNAQDCYLTAKLHEILTEEVKSENGLESVVKNILVPTAKAVAKVILAGVLVDQEYLRQYRKKLLREIAEREQELKECAARYGVADFKPSSPVQVADMIFERFGLAMPKIRMKGSRTAEWSTAKAVIDKIRRTATEEQRMFFDSLLAYRLYAKTLNTYVDGLLEQVSVDGRVHPELFIAGTSTGRLSCARPALQQIPLHVGTDVRRAFIAPPGYSLIEVDESQVEMRLAGWVSREPVLINAFTSGQDIYRMTASQVFGIPLEQVSDFLRQLSKSVALGLLYGRSGAAIAEGREMDTMEADTGNRWTIRQAEEFHDQFLAGMPQLARWIKEQIRVGIAEHRSVTPFGRIRRFPLITSYMRGEVERQLVNSVIQGGAADITTLAMVRLTNELPDGARIILAVHDSVLCEVRNDLVPSVVRQIRDVMEHPPNPPIDDRGIPFACSVKIGQNWSQMEKYSV